MGTGPGALNMPNPSSMGVSGVPGCFRRSQRASGTAAEKDFHFMVPSRPKGSSTCITGRWNAPKMVLFFRGFEGQMPKVKTMLPCTREHDFQGCGASDFVSFRAPHSRHFLGPFFCTPIWFFRCEVENMGGQREHRRATNHVKRDPDHIFSSFGIRRVAMEPPESFLNGLWPDFVWIPERI